MNKQDRKELSEALAKAEEALDTIREISEREQEKYDNLPEGLQASDRGDSIQEAIGALEDAADEMEGAIESAKELTD